MQLIFSCVLLLFMLILPIICNINRVTQHRIGVNWSRIRCWGTEPVRANWSRNRCCFFF